jgi:ankyrin repeat protein
MPLTSINSKHPLAKFATQPIQDGIIKSEALRYIIRVLEQKLIESSHTQTISTIDAKSLYDQVKAIRLPFYFTELTDDARRLVDEQAVEIIADLVSKDLTEDVTIKQLFIVIKSYRHDYLTLLQTIVGHYASSIKQFVANNHYVASPKADVETEYSILRQNCRHELHQLCWQNKLDELKAKLTEYAMNWRKDKTWPLGIKKPTQQAEQDYIFTLLTEEDGNGHTLYHIAAIQGNEPLLRLLQSFGSGLEVLDDHGSLPQHYAAKYGHSAFVTVCVTLAPKLINTVDANGRTLLHYAAFNGYLDLIIELLAKNAALETATDDGRVSTFELQQKKTGLEIAKEGEIVSALHSAVTGDQAAAVLVLLEKGANAGYRHATNTAHETTEFAWALSRGNLSIIQLLYPYSFTVSYILIRKEFFDAIPLQYKNEQFILIAREICITTYYHELVTKNAASDDQACCEIYKELVAFIHNFDEQIEAKLHAADPKKYKEKERALNLLIENQRKLIEEHSASLEKKDQALDEERTQRSEAEKYNTVMRQQLDEAKQSDRSKRSGKKKKQDNSTESQTTLITREQAFAAAKKCIDEKECDGLQEILNSQPMIEVRDEGENTLLHYAVAAKKPSLSIVTLLDDNQVSITAINNKGEPAVFSAIRNGDDKISFHLLRNEHRIKSSLDKNGNTVLHVAAAAGREAIVTWLLQQSKNLNLADQTNNSGQTALFAAVSAETNKTFESLLKYLSVETKDAEGNTVAHEAARVGNLAILKIIAKKYPKLLLQANSEGNLPIHIAVLHNQPKAVALLAQHHDDLTGVVNQQRQNVLQLAAINPDSIEVFESLLKRKESVDLFKHRDAKGKSALHMTCAANNSRALGIIIANTKLTVNINETDLTGLAPVHDALLNESVDCLATLLKEGANLYLRDQSNNDVCRLARQLIVKRNSEPLEQCLALLNQYKQEDAIKRIAESTRAGLKIEKQSVTALNKGSTKDMLKEKVIGVLQSCQPFKIYIAAIDDEGKLNQVVNTIAESVKAAVYAFSNDNTAKFYQQFEKDHNAADLLFIIREAILQALEKTHNSDQLLSVLEPTVSFRQDQLPLTVDVFRKRLTTILHKTVGAMEKLASAEYIDQANQIDVGKVTAIAQVASAGLGAASGVITSVVDKVIPVPGASQVVGKAIPMAQTLIQVGVPAIVNWLNERDVKEKQAAANRVLQVLTLRTVGEANINFDEITKVIDLMVKRFCEFLLSENTTVDAATLLANCIGERILIHLAKENTDTVRGRKNAVIRTGINFVEFIRTTTDKNYTPQQEQILTLPERCLHAILEERTCDSSVAGMHRITYCGAEIHIKDVVERSGLKVWQPNQAKFIYYTLGDKKTQHELFGFCQTTEVEPEKRDFAELPYHNQTQVTQSATKSKQSSGMHADTTTSTASFWSQSSPPISTATSSTSASANAFASTATNCSADLVSKR